jgi:hypothetical protein
MLAALAAVALVVGVVGSTIVVTHPPQAAADKASHPVVTVQGVQSDVQKPTEQKAR